MTDRDSRSKQPDEPSVDEILASIRRIVFEDDGTGPGPDTDIREAEIPTADAPVTEIPTADVPVADVPAADMPVADMPVADMPVARVGRAAPDPMARPAETGAPPVEPPRESETAAGEDRGAADPGVAEEVPPPKPPPSAPAPDIAEATAGAAEKAPPSEPAAPVPAPDGPEAAAGPAAEEPVGAGFDSGPDPDAGLDPDASPDSDSSQDSDAGPDADAGETVLLLTDMIAPDGSVVRLDPRPAEAPLPDGPPERGSPAPGAGAGGGERVGEGALDPVTQDSLAATVREWLDRNAPGMVDEAARRELQKLAERQT